MMTTAITTTAKSTLFAAAALGYVFGLCALAFYLSHRPIIAQPSPRIAPPYHLAQGAYLVPDFAAITPFAERQAAFFAFLSPPLVAANLELRQRRQQLVKIQHTLLTGQILSPSEEQTLQQLNQHFAVKSAGVSISQLNTLLNRVDEIPLTMLISQAALASAWGTQPFARRANNYFGQRCFAPSCGLKPSPPSTPKHHKSKEIRYELKTYKSIEQAVTEYVHSLNTHSAYAEMRSLRALMRRTRQPLNATILAAGLLNHSRYGEAYVAELRSLINTIGPYLNSPSSDGRQDGRQLAGQLALSDRLVSEVESQEPKRLEPRLIEPLPINPVTPQSTQ